MTLSFDVTLYTLQLGSRDSTTGWYQKNYSTSTITMPIVSRAAAHTPLPPGVHVRLDAVGLTQDPVYEGDEIKNAADQFYQVETIQPHYFGDSFWFRECQLTMLPFKNLTGAGYTASSVEDPRYRTKVYLETYLSGSALPNYIVAYGMPDYPLTRVFKTKGVDLVFGLGEPNSTPDKDPLTEAAYGYEEHVPIQTFCIDKSNITGTKLMWQAETELRSVAESYPGGSLRALDRRRPNTQVLGSTTLYSAEYILNYRRDTS